MFVFRDAGQYLNVRVRPSGAPLQQATGAEASNLRKFSDHGEYEAGPMSVQDPNAVQVGRSSLGQFIFDKSEVGGAALDQISS